MDPERDAEALRRRLYRADASSEDVASYRLLANEDARGAPDVGAPTGRADDEQGSEAGSPPGRRGIPLTIAGVLGAAVVLVGAAVGVGTLAPPPTASPTAPVWSAAPRDPGDSMVAVAVSDHGPRRDATGAARPDGGFRFVYTVARGDTVQGIARRFDLCTADVALALPYGAGASSPPPGQRLLLQRLSATSRQPDGTGSC